MAASQTRVRVHLASPFRRRSGCNLLRSTLQNKIYLDFCELASKEVKFPRFRVYPCSSVPSVGGNMSPCLRQISQLSQLIPVQRPMGILISLSVERSLRVRFGRNIVAIVVSPSPSQRGRVLIAAPVVTIVVVFIFRAHPLAVCPLRFTEDSTTEWEWWQFIAEHLAK